LDHLGQRLEDLLLSAVERFEFVNVKVFEGLKFHLDIVWRLGLAFVALSRPDVAAGV
jgi:hypothetical protein